MRKKQYKHYQLSPEAEEVIIQHLIRRVKETGKSVSKTEIANELIIKHKLV